MLTKKQKELVEKAYFTANRAGSFTNPQTLRKILLKQQHKRRGRSVRVPSTKKVKEFLQSKRAYTLHQPARRRYAMKKVMVGGVNVQLQFDLVDMQSWAAQNDNYKYILLGIDCFSRYAYAAPLKTKQGNVVSGALKTLLDEAEERIDRRIEKIQTDEGLEFYNKQVKSMLTNRGIYLFSTKSPTKSQMAERLIRTLRARQERHNTYKGTRRWIDSFFDLVKSYNKTPHSALPRDMAPADVNLKNESQVWHSLYGKDLLTTPPLLQRQLRARKQGKFIAEKGLKIGDAVRLSKRKRTFEKAYYQNWTDEVFFVARVSKNTRPVTYKIKDDRGEVLEGVFYRQELTPVRLDAGTFAIDRVLEQETRSDGKKYLHVEWRGYPQSTWIRSDQLK